MLAFRMHFVGDAQRSLPTAHRPTRAPKLIAHVSCVLGSGAFLGGGQVATLPFVLLGSGIYYSGRRTAPLHVLLRGYAAGFPTVLLLSRMCGRRVQGN
jgi:hypothetical protein